jgi:2-polyprenyl-3-methyl-5-hydroxy-6-metoxy-1,4-benzoquinol methylase
MAGTFDAQHLASFFDAYGEREWDRHDAGPGPRVSFRLHCQLLAEYVQPDDLVLDAGAGPGRFTIELARLGARVHVGDLSENQLRLNRQHVQDAGVADSVVATERLDICDLSRLATATFDVVVCYGGPLSYVRDRAPDALAELVRVTRPGGHVLLSVMSTAGSMRAFLPAVLDEHRRYGPDHTERMITSGDLERDTNHGNEVHMFRWSELEALCAAHGQIVRAAAANYFSSPADPALLDDLTDEEWQALLTWEQQVCFEPGLLDAGTHIIAALRVP